MWCKSSISNLIYQLGFILFWPQLKPLLVRPPIITSCRVALYIYTPYTYITHKWTLQANTEMNLRLPLSLRHWFPKRVDVLRLLAVCRLPKRRARERWASAAEIVALAARKCCQRNRNVLALAAPTTGTAAASFDQLLPNCCWLSTTPSGQRMKHSCHALSPQRQPFFLACHTHIQPGGLPTDLNDFAHLSQRLATRMSLAFINANCVWTGRVMNGSSVLIIQRLMSAINLRSVEYFAALTEHTFNESCIQLANI